MGRVAVCKQKIKARRQSDAATGLFGAKRRLVSSGGDAGFGFGDGVIDYLDGAGTVAAFVVLGPLQSCFGFTQMRQRCPHVRLIGSNGLKTHGADQCRKN